MNKFFKKSLKLHLLGVCFAAAMLSLALPASAQLKTETVSMTNWVAVTTTNTSIGSAVIDASRVKDVALQITCKLQGSGTTAIPFVVQRSVDGSNWADAFTISITPAGTATKTVLTNINTQAIPYWRIYSIQNDNASAITNLVAVYTLKRNAD